jgi:hypothetical protein
MISLLVFELSFAKNEILNFQGEARSKKGELVYTEKHKATFKADRIQDSLTLYYSPEGDLIGELKSDYSKNIYLPDYTFRDLRTGMFHDVKLDDGKLKIIAKKTKDAPEEKEQFDIKDNMISGQGFHYFIREHLNSFVENKNKDVKFVMPGLLDYFSFNIGPERRPSSEDSIIHIKMSVNNVILKMFVSTVKMQYDKLKRHLLSYEGASNLLSKDGKNQDVVITYKYNN